jgi:hypothetical protein
VTKLSLYDSYVTHPHQRANFPVQNDHSRHARPTRFPHLLPFAGARHGAGPRYPRLNARYAGRFFPSASSSPLST